MRRTTLVIKCVLILVIGNQSAWGIKSLSRRLEHSMVVKHLDHILNDHLPDLKIDFRKVIKGDLPLIHTVQSFIKILRNDEAVTLKRQAFFSPHQNIELFSLQFKNIPICKQELKSTILKNGSLVITGHNPSFRDVADTEFLPLSSSKELINSYLFAHQITFSNLTLHESCWWESDHDGLYPAHIWYFDTNTGPYEIIATDEIVFFQKRFFGITTSFIDAYEKNPLEGVIKTFEKSLTGTGFLESTHIKTNPNPSSRLKDYEKAYSTDHDFRYDPSDDRFAEASIFVHTQNMLEYLEKLGFTWYQKFPLEIELHASSGGRVSNNAVFIPGSTGIAPKIQIGDGDGQVLKNLAFDRDVGAHELSHLVVYRSVTQTFGESLALHEALADFFPMSLANSDCFAPSICPGGTKDICFERGSCLRTASNTITYGDQVYSMGNGHIKGQLITGMLKDLKDSMDPEVLVQTVFNSIDFLVSNSGFRDFIISLMLADQNLSQGIHACAILDAALNRELGVILENVDCQNQDTWFVTSKEIPEIEPPKQQVSKKNTPSCGFLDIQRPNSSQALQSSLQDFLFIILFGLPLMMIFWTKRELAEPNLKITNKKIKDQN